LQLVAPVRLVAATPALRALAALSLVYAQVQLAFITYFVSFLNLELGLTLVAAGLIYAVAHAASIVGRIAWGIVADRVLSPRTVLSVLGMVSGKNVVVYDTPANLNDVEIHGHMIALDESFTARNYDSGPPRGELTIWGGFAQKKIGAVGIFGSGHVILHGYNKVYHFDRNLMINSPPGYPPTGRYILTLWEEISPPQA